MPRSGSNPSNLEAEMKKAVDFAVAAPYPSVDEVEQDVYA